MLRILVVSAFVLGISTALLSAEAQAWPWQSCDGKWANAWKDCQEEADKKLFTNFSCYPLPASFHPDCSPNDPYLKEYPGGKKSYDEAQRERAEQMREAQINLAHISVSGFEYTFDGDGVSLTAVIANGHPAGKLNDIKMNCAVVANNSVELWNGAVVSSPNIVSGGSARVPLFFEQPKYDLTAAILGSAPKNERFSSVSAQAQRVDKLSISCEKRSASVGNRFRGAGITR